MAELENKRIRRTPQERAAELESKIEKAKESIADLEEKKQAAISDYDAKIAAVQEQADTVAVPIPKGNDDLVEAVNKAIAELQADGTLTELSNKYLGKDFSKELTLEEIQQ